MEFETERPHQLKVDLRIIRGMSDEDLRWLVAWSSLKRTTFKHFAGWLESVLMAELACRSNPQLESEMITIPRMTAMELSDFCQGSYVLCRLPLTESQSKFADQISLLVMADVTAALEHFDIGTIVT